MSNDQLALNHEQFVGRLVRLAAFDPDKDAEIVARWSRDTEYHRLGDDDAAYPKPARQVRDWLEHDHDRRFRFAIRTLRDDWLIGDIGGTEDPLPIGCKVPSSGIVDWGPTHKS